MSNLIRGNPRVEATVQALEQAAESAAPTLLRRQRRSWGLSSEAVGLRDA